MKLVPRAKVDFLGWFPLRPSPVFVGECTVGFVFASTTRYSVLVNTIFVPRTEERIYKAVRLSSLLFIFDLVGLMICKQGCSFYLFLPGIGRRIGGSLKSHPSPHISAPLQSLLSLRPTCLLARLPTCLPGFTPRPPCLCLPVLLPCLA